MPVDTQSSGFSNLKPLMMVRLAARLAFRELKGGIKGFRIFLACLALGVMAIAGVGSLSEALVSGLNEKGQSILGGDLSITMMHRTLNASEEEWLQSRYDISSSREMRSMVRFSQDQENDDVDQMRHTLVELKAVDSFYPLYGTLEIQPAIEPRVALGLQKPKFTKGLEEEKYGALVEPSLLETLGIEVGDTIKIGSGFFPVTGVILSEPDRLSGGFSIGPRVLLSEAGARHSGLYQPGSFVENNYRLRAKTQLSESDLKAAKGEMNSAFPDAGWQIKERTDASPSLRRSIERMAIFLTLVGLTALVVGGIGVGNAVRAYLDHRRNTIAIIKSLGATGALVFLFYMLQIFLMALLGIFIGLALGALTPLLANGLLATLLPFDLDMRLFPAPLAAATGFGVLTAIGFALNPLARAQAIPVAGLFRDSLVSEKTTLPFWIMCLYAVCLLGLVLISFLVVRYIEITFWFLAGVTASYLILRIAAGIISNLARFAGRRRKLPSPEFRIALKNIHRPDAPTQAVMLSVGLAVTLLSVISLVDGNLKAEIDGDIPDMAPSFFLLDVQTQQLEGVKSLAQASDDFRELNTSPMLRGKLTHVNGVPSRDVTPAPEAEWVLRGDRGLTYAAGKPEGVVLTEGEWWPSDYGGPPLVSMDYEIAEGLGLEIGDTVTMNVLGRPFTAEIANMRKVDWESMGINFVFLFSPQPLASAPHAHLMTISLDHVEPDNLRKALPVVGEAALRRALINEYPNITVIRIKESLETIKDILDDFGLAVRAMSALSIITGILVLSGAIGGGHRKRIYDAVIMKVLGAERRRILYVYLIEYGLTGLGAALIATFIGTFAAWAIVKFVLGITWVMLPGTLVLTVACATGISMFLGLLGTWRSLGAKAAPVLRSD
ncbi:MAG: ABC transporter permease [Candidatus Micropelagos thuwalensis]